MINAENIAKVCILVTVHSTFDTRIFHKQARTLVQAGYDVTLIAQHDKDEIVNGVNIIALPKPRSRFRRFFGLAWQAFRLALHQRADVYHFHDPELLLIGILLKIFTHAKVIYDVHENYRQIIRLKYWIPKPIRGLVADLVGYVEVIGGSIFDAIITVNEFIKARFPSDKVVIIKNYPLLDIEKNDSGTVPSCLDVNLIYVGGLNRGRGIYEMIKTMAYLDRRQNVRLRLLGRFDELDELDTDKKIRTLPGFKQTELIGWVPHPKVYDYLHTSHIGLLCLHPVGGYPLSLPVKLFEYMAAGLPVIASEFPLWKEIIEGNRCGLTVDPLNPRGIAKAIEYLIEHPELRQEMGANGRQAVQEKYNWEQESKKLLNLYTRLTTVRRNAPSHLTKRKDIKVFLLDTWAYPYRLPIFEELSKKVTLDVFFSKMRSKGRLWEVPMEKYKFNYEAGKAIKGLVPTKLLRNSYDLYIVGQLGIQSALGALFTLSIAKIHRKPLILWTDFIDTEYYGKKKSIKKFVGDLIRKFFVNSCTAAIAYGVLTKRYLETIISAKIKIFCDIQALPEEYFESGNVKKAYTEYKNSRVILSVSYLRPEKGLRYLIKAFKKLNLRDTVLIIIGTGKEEKNLKSLAKDDENIRFLGYKQGKEKAKYYSLADIFVLPSLHDPWGLVVNEAMYYGLPIVVTNTSGSSELVTDNGFVVEPGNSEALAIAIQKLMNNEELRKQMGKRSKEHIKKYNLEYAVNSFLKAIDFTMAQDAKTANISKTSSRI